MGQTWVKTTLAARFCAAIFRTYMPVEIETDPYYSAETWVRKFHFFSEKPPKSSDFRGFWSG